MNPREAAELLGHCAMFDNRKPSQGAAVAWASALNDVPLDADAKAAVAAYYTTAPKDPDARLWIMPHHVRTLRTKIRSARLENFQYEPLPDETVPQYLTRLRGQTQAIASGRCPAPTGRPALEGGPSREFMQELEARGWEGFRAVPDSDEDVAEGELVEPVRRAGPLGVECPLEVCRAAIGKPCKSHTGSEKHPLGKPRLTPHAARKRAANGEEQLTPAQLAAQEQAIRTRSELYLARQQADEDIPDADVVDEEAAP